jgi:hypothetical protein
VKYFRTLVAMCWTAFISKWKKKCFSGEILPHACCYVLDSIHIEMEEKRLENKFQVLAAMSHGIKSNGAKYGKSWEVRWAASGLAKFIQTFALLLCLHINF